jgi:peptide/nickel transport system substrate-binding protein
MGRVDTFESLLRAAQNGQISRRSLIKRAAALGLATPAVATLLAACADRDDDVDDEAPAVEPDDDDEEPAAPDDDEDEDEEDDEEPVDDTDDDTDVGEGQRGGTLRVAAIGEPSTLDMHQTTAGLTAQIGYCMYETLFAYDQNFEPSPMLLDSYTVNDDGSVHTFVLRQGVMFHNGEEMTAEDVVASIERWGRISGVGQNIMDLTESIDVIDDYTVEWVTDGPYGTMPVALSSNTQACAIYPKALIDESTDEPIASEEIIGTGPYRLVEHVPDRHIRFERFEDYSALEGESDGYGGRKHAYLDVIEFVPVSDESSRIAGMQSGEYHIAMDLGNDHYETLVADENLRVEILPPSLWDVFFLNWRTELMGDVNIRKAFQASLDHQPIMESSRGGGDFTSLDPSFMMQPTPWYSTAGEEFYNINDPELAAQYLEEAGYDDEPIRFMATQEYSYMYGAAVIAVQQLEDAGFNIDLQINDWATVLQRRAQEDEWEVFVTGHGFVPDPSQLTFIGQINVYPGWFSDEEAMELTRDMLAEPDLERRIELWEQVQYIAHDTVACVKTGDASVIAVWSADVGGFRTQLQRGVPYWDIWLED